MKVTALGDFPWQAQRQANGRYRNLEAGATRGGREFLRWKLGFGPEESPARGVGLPIEFKPAEPNLDADPACIAATWIGHSTFLLQLGGRCFLADPQFSEFCAPVPFEQFRRHLPPALRIEQLPPIDAVLLSHNHYDHLDRSSLLALGRDIPVICPAGVGRLLAGWGFTAVTEMTWGETGGLDGVEITCLPAQHGSARTLFDRDESLWCGWMLERAGVKAIFLGDTGYAPFFEGIGSRFGPFDLAMIPIAAYRPFWFMHPLHMQPSEAVRVHGELRSKLSIAMHWGTFALADEPLAEPPLLLADALAAQGVSTRQFRLPRLGETIQG